MIVVAWYAVAGRLSLLLLALFVIACNVEVGRARKTLLSPDPAAREQALEALAEGGEPADAKLVAPLLRDSSARFRTSPPSRFATSASAPIPVPMFINWDCSSTSCSPVVPLFHSSRSPRFWRKSRTVDSRGRARSWEACRVTSKRYA